MRAAERVNLRVDRGFEQLADYLRIDKPSSLSLVRRDRLTTVVTF
jgi:hypothetical protein